MIIRVDSIPAEGLRVEIEEGEKVFGSVFRDSGYSLVGPLGASLEFSLLDEGGVHVTGRVRARLEATCHRCLGRFCLTIDSAVDLFFSRLQVPRGTEVELKAPDLEVNALRGEGLNTDDILLGQVAEELPLTALCSEDCRGLCQGCGVDLNKASCRCVAEEKIDARLAVLKDFCVKAE